MPSLSPDQLQQLESDVKLLVLEVGDFIRQQVGNVKEEEITDKALNSLVSYVDETAEEKLVAGLSKLLPEATFLTEEGTVIAQKSYHRWIIDPLDGTTNFLFQLPCFSVSVALEEADEIVLGMVYEINRDECFSAWRNGGAFLNGQPIRCRENTELSHSLMATGFPYYDYQRMGDYFKAFTYFMEHTRGIRRWGSAAVDLAYVACGRFDGFFEYSLNAWDVAAGILLVQEAGGKVSDFSGGENYLFGQEMVATSSGVFEQVLEPIRKAFRY
jgi:myo-inositol-1(or 4)-monophosphatase